MAWIMRVLETIVWGGGGGRRFLSNLIWILMFFASAKIVQTSFFFTVLDMQLGKIYIL